ncbi:MAG: Dabb family protein [Clostridia bacterium]|nr:Dabb family protein [Clostridia bacterium]
MVKHIVMFSFLPEAEGRTKKENAAIAAEMLSELQGKIPSLIKSEVHLNSDSADQSNFDLVLVSEHEDWSGLREYAVHPLHVKVGEFIKKVRESRSCVDYEF